MERWNNDIESSLLGNCISCKQVFIKLLNKGVEAEDFYSTKNQNVFKTLLEAYSIKNSTDIAILCEIGKKYSILPSYLTDLLDSTLTSHDIIPLVNELLNHRVTRERLKIAKDIQNGTLASDGDIKARFDKLDFIKSKMGNDNTITTLDKVSIVDVYEMEKIPTGFKEIDNKLLGFALGSLTVITGYNGNGKSTLINQMCICESLSRGYKVFAYSPELTNSNFKSWLYPTIANEDHFTDKEYRGVKYKSLGNIGAKYIDEWVKDKLYIYSDDSLANGEKQLLLDMQRLAENKSVKVFIIDNLMKVDLEGSFTNELIAQKRFTNKLKEFARRYNCVVHLVAHPKKPQNGTSKITKYDISGSGDITNLADYVISVSRVSEEDKKEMPILKDSIVKVMKDRIKGNGELVANLNYNTTRRRYYSENIELNRDYGYTMKYNLVQVELNNNGFSEEVQHG